MSVKFRRHVTWGVRSWWGGGGGGGAEFEQGRCRGPGPGGYSLPLTTQWRRHDKRQSEQCAQPVLDTEVTAQATRSANGYRVFLISATTRGATSYGQHCCRTDLQSDTFSKLFCYFSCCDFANETDSFGWTLLLPDWSSRQHVQQMTVIFFYNSLPPPPFPETFVYRVTKQVLRRENANEYKGQ